MERHDTNPVTFTRFSAPFQGFGIHVFIVFASQGVKYKNVHTL
jgi:hypothetical protein